MAKRKSSFAVNCKRKEKTGGTRKEPAGKNSLAHVLWELDIVNAKREKEGKSPLSYGKYVSTRNRK